MLLYATTAVVAAGGGSADELLDDPNGEGLEEGGPPVWLRED